MQFLLCETNGCPSPGSNLFPSQILPAKSVQQCNCEKVIVRVTFAFIILACCYFNRSNYIKTKQIKYIQISCTITYIICLPYCRLGPLLKIPRGCSVIWNVKCKVLVIEMNVPIDIANQMSSGIHKWSVPGNIIIDNERWEGGERGQARNDMVLELL